MDTLRTSTMALAALCLGLPVSAALAAKTGAVYDFTGGDDGATPLSPLTQDTIGNAYGTTQAGGAYQLGTIFKLDTSGRLNTVRPFTDFTSGFYPSLGVALIRDVLYGSALGGTTLGTYSVLYSVNTDGSDYTVLHEMTRADGEYLVGLMQPSPAGGEFGVGRSGGAHDGGTLFYLSATNTLFVAHDFAGGEDGQRPSYLIEDAHHNLFGSTLQGGACSSTKPTLRNGCGTIFEYVPSTRTYTVLYRFQDKADGYSPLIGAVGPDGTLYGVGTQGGAYGHGALFALAPGGNGYSFSVLSPIIEKYAQDYAANPPALSPSGALVGASGSSTYVYQNGKYTVHYLVPGTSAGQYLIPTGRPGAFLGTATQGGITGGTCPLVNGCGYIYYGRQ